VPGLRRLVVDGGTTPEGRDCGGALAEDHWTEGAELLHQWRDLHRLRLFSDAFSRCVRPMTRHDTTRHDTTRHDTRASTGL
jgi:hypothetical protein